MDHALTGLNNAQRTAVTSQASVLQVLAPPGSGKTKTLTARVAYLIAHQQLKPWNIIVCTFTVKAAREMQERIRCFVGEELERKLKIGTFHGISLRYLRRYGSHIGLPDNFGVADTSDSMAILKRIIKQRGKECTIEPSASRARISTQKAKGMDSAQFRQTLKNSNREQQEFAEIFSEYESMLRASKLLDYDDLLLRCSSLLRSHPDCVSNVEAILVDEFQDTNSVQYELMCLFAQRRNRITIVGDPDQSIYGWRSAEIKNLSLMKQRWPDTLTVNLEENYRSSGAILHAAQKVIEQDESRPPKKLQATHSVGQRPVLRKLPSAADEARWLVSEIERMQALTGNLLQASDFAILLRTAALSRVIESALGKAGMPYRMVGGTRFFDRAEVKILIDYLRVINAPTHSEALERILNVPPRGMGDATVKNLQDEARQKGMPLWSLILDLVRGRARPTSKLPAQAQRGLESLVDIVLRGRKKMANSESSDALLVDLVSYVMNKINFEIYLKQKYPEDYEMRWANVEDLIAQAADASSPDRQAQMMQQDNDLPVLGGAGSPPEPSSKDALSHFLAHVALTASADEKAAQHGEKAQQVTISTVHAAKGLEWPVIFIPACFNGSIPHSRAEDNDEERRLLYVGMTRAQALLYLSWPTKDSQKQERTVSPFLTQPGVSILFEEHGPSIAVPSVQSLAITLRRDCPDETTITESKLTLERDEDNHWPLDGEVPLGQGENGVYGQQDSGLPAFGTTMPASWINGSVTMHQQDVLQVTGKHARIGFVSAAARFDQLRKEIGERRMRKIEKRTAEKDDDGNGLRGRKKQIAGQGSIASFFSKQHNESNAPEPGLIVDEQAGQKRRDHPNQDMQQPLREIFNINTTLDPHPLPAKPLLPPTYKPHTAPLLKRPTPTTSSDAPQASSVYVFLSSSPPQAEDHGRPLSGTIMESEPATNEKPLDAGFRHASTLHTTSMQKGAPQRKTLGVRRTMNGWANRGGKF